KLASIACPLKVLITVGEWSERWRHGGLRKEMTACWQHVVRVYHSQAPRVGIMGFLVGERHEHDLRFFAWALQPDGEFLEPESELVYVHLPTEGYTPIAKETAASTARGSV